MVMLGFRSGEEVSFVVNMVTVVSCIVGWSSRMYCCVSSLWPYPTDGSYLGTCWVKKGGKEERK